MKEFKIPTPLPWVIIVLGIILYGTTSCGFVHKSKESIAATTEDVKVSSEKDQSLQLKESSGKKSTEATEDHGITIDTSRGLKIVFRKPDSTGAEPTSPVMVWYDSVGNLMIDPGGRPLKSITDTRHKSTKEMKSTKQSGADSGRIFERNDQLKEKYDSANYKQKLKVSGSNTTRFNWNWLWWLLLLPIGWFLWTRRKNLPLINKLFPDGKI